MTHADEAARLAEKIEKDDPGMAGVIHALLALGDARPVADLWNKLDGFDDLPDQLDQDYIFEASDGGQVKWRLSADNPSSVEQLVGLDGANVWKDLNDAVDEYTRWRYA